MCGVIRNTHHPKPDADVDVLNLLVATSHVEMDDQLRECLSLVIAIRPPGQERSLPLGKFPALGDGRNLWSERAPRYVRSWDAVLGALSRAASACLS